MKKSVCALSVLSACAAFAAPVAEEVDGRWQFTVPEGETYTLTADDVAAIGDRPFQKAGGGTLIAGDEMAAHTGDVYLVGGVYKHTTHLALGATNAPAGSVHVDGGTLWNTVKASHSGTPPSIERPLFLAGSGYNGLGAVTNSVNSQNLCHNVAFTDDVKIAGSETLNFRYDNLDMGGFKLMTEFHGGYAFMFVAIAVKNPGDIEVLKGPCGFESNSGTTGTPAQTMTIREGSSLRVSVVLGNLGWTLHFADRTMFENVGWDALMIDPATGRHGTKNTGSFTGPVVLDGTLKADRTAGMGVTFTGPVSGPGGFLFDSGLWLRLGGAGSTFEGGVEVVGVDGKGGLAVTADGAVPVDGAPIKVKDATLGLYAAKTIALPALVFDGTATVTGDVERTTRAASLVKTGDGDLTVYGSLAVSGATDIREGALRFATRVPDFIPGLHWAHNNATGYDGTADYTPEQVQAFASYEGVDRTGVGYAYKGWVNTVATTNKSDGRVDWHNNHWYAGYVNIPGEPGADVPCRIISSISRNCLVSIDGVVVHRIDDGRVIVPTDYVDPGTDLGWRRHAWGHVLTFKAGWHRIYCYMGNHWMSGGPTGCELAMYGYWPSNFGIGVNFNASENDDWNTLTNTASYVKLLDPGDGSVFRTETNENQKAAFDATTYRPTFGGPVAFASGTALDIGDTAPYAPVVFPSLTGVPTIRNGRVESASSTWTLRAADATGGAPLTLAAGAELAFPAGDVTVDMSAEELEALEASRKQAPFVLMQAEAGASIPPNAFKASEGLQVARWRVAVEDGRVVLASASGLAVLFR